MFKYGRLLGRSILVKNKPCNTATVKMLSLRLKLVDYIIVPTSILPFMDAAS